MSRRRPPRPFERPTDTRIRGAGRRFRTWSPPPPPAPAGRVCADPGCATVLSRYNVAETCHLHRPDEPEPATDVELGLHSSQRQKRRRVTPLDDGWEGALRNAALLLVQGAEPEDVARITGVPLPEVLRLAPRAPHNRPA